MFAEATTALNKPDIKLSAEELQSFNKRGFTDPFDILDKETIEKIRPTFNKIIESGFNSPIYQRTTHRDWHLHYKNLLLMVYRPEVIGRIQSILGENLMIWRSSIFHKAPGDGALPWHQSSLFAGEEYGIFKPAILPPPDCEEYGDIFNLSCWIALDDVTFENGAMQVAAGTHYRQYPVRKVPFKNSVFANVAKDNLSRSGDTERLEQLHARIACETIFNPETDGDGVSTITMKAGQGFLFTDRVMHSSLPNITKDQRRLAINFRVTIPEVSVYSHRAHGDMIDGNDHNIEKHGCVMLAGKATSEKNIFFN